MTEVVTAALVFENVLKTISLEGDLKWEPLREGLEIARIYQSPGGAAMGFVRFAPGAVLPRHWHEGYEHILVLRGSQQDDYGDHREGALLVHPPGTTHRVTSRNGCVVLAYWEKPVRFSNMGEGEST
jgi:anti-sigma factor ChrR (cupin superfamily)